MTAALEVFRGETDASPLTIGSLLVNLGAVEKRDGNLEQASTYYRAGIEVMEPGSLSAAVVKTNLGNIAYARKEYEESVRLHREALSVLEASLSPMHPSIGAILNNLGLALSQLGERDEGVSYQLRALEISGEVYGKDSRDYNITLGNLAWDLEELGRYKEASDSWLTVADWYARNDPESPKGPIRKVRAYATIGGRGVAWEEAEAGMLAGFEHLRALAGPDHQYVVAARNLIAGYYERWGKPDRAAGYADEP